MKKLLLTFAAVVVTMASAFAQGQVTFSNFSTAEGVNSKAVFAGTTTGVTSPSYTAQLLRVNGGVETPVGAPVNFRPQAAAAGYTVPAVFTIDGVAAGAQASFRMVVLSGSTFSEAAIMGRSSVSTVTLGGGTVTPPSLIGLTDISGVQNIQVVPEPSTIALGILGAAALLLRRRK